MIKSPITLKPLSVSLAVCSLASGLLATSNALASDINSQPSVDSLSKSSSVVSAEPASKPLTTAEKWSSAISNDQVEKLKAMLLDARSRVDAGKTLLKQRAPNGKSALMVASKTGDVQFAKRLVALGVNVNELTVTGGTPFMFAVLGNHIELAGWLHSVGANIDAKGSNGWSAATIAGAKGQSDMLRWLISAGADVDSPDVYRFTPLMRAVDNRHLESARLLLKQGRSRVDAKDEADNTALHYAVANQQEAMVKLLLQFGADPVHANRDGIRAIDIATEHPAMMMLFK